MAVVGMAAATAVACPVCETETGRQIRQGIFHAGFGDNAFLTVLPFVVMGLAVRSVVGPALRGQARLYH